MGKSSSNHHFSGPTLNFGGVIYFLGGSKQCKSMVILKSFPYFFVDFVLVGSMMIPDPWLEIFRCLVSPDV